MNSRVSQSGGLVSRVDSPGTIPSGAMSPAALLEKEEEIRRMRELINKKRNRTSCGSLHHDPGLNAASACVRWRHSTDIPDYPMNGVHSDGSEEHSVLAELLPDSQPLSQVSTSVPSSASTSSSTTLLT
ncbi:hypothetical protein A0H81_11117 [Grifola frondosa]|uniref:Uncharacterized protein n=1 Tax=Grifola frondosa TaxID=5627 RepID=A0A1C7LW04_GRIFR|nr:hypothetical protein A0H81_11117 [Grifola frondosa]